MKIVELSDKAYGDFMELKNHITLKTRIMSNREALKNFNDCDFREVDLEKEYTFSECIENVVGTIWDEQKTGQVNPIT